MSKRGLLRAVAVTAISVAGATNAHAQQRNRFDAVRASVLSIRAQSDSLHAIVSADSARRVKLPVLRMYAGLEFRGDSTIMPVGYLPALDSAFARARGEASTVLGAGADTMFRGIYISAYAQGELSAVDSRADIMSLYVRGRPVPSIRLRLKGLARPMTTTSVSQASREPVSADLTRFFVDLYRDAAGFSVPMVIAEWAESKLPIRESRRDQLAGDYLRLAMYGPEPWHGCMIDGARAACRAALGIVPSNDTISAWYTVDRQRAIVARAYQFRSGNRQSNTFDLQHECVVEYSNQACHDVLVNTDHRDVWLGNVYGTSPTTSDTRLDLLHRILLRGGPGAYQRLITSTSNDVRTVLETTAGGSIDSLIDDWRADVLASRPAPPTPAPVEFASCLLLGGIIVGLSVRRRP